ncbi:hypothetical protein Pla144_45690 [Bythopirellula polymerisocia]|uniref:Uncharacterized protein n=1 Tax=Bythopirellula polymerisocia TaxID=2528003 RepID=A0A5C6CEW6_9BACT|nr:hypothetical protein Pla144_45690 [Bythopirellula polymerisocia]
MIAVWNGSIIAKKHLLLNRNGRTAKKLRSNSEMNKRCCSAAYTFKKIQTLKNEFLSLYTLRRIEHIKQVPIPHAKNALASGT